MCHSRPFEHDGKACPHLGRPESVLLARATSARVARAPPHSGRGGVPHVVRPSLPAQGAGKEGRTHSTVDTVGTVKAGRLPGNPEDGPRSAQHVTTAGRPVRWPM